MYRPARTRTCGCTDDPCARHEYAIELAEEARDGFDVDPDADAFADVAADDYGDQLYAALGGGW